MPSETKAKQSVIVGDCRGVLSALPDEHFHACVTSPPYFGLRDYGVDGQIGLESSLDEFVGVMVEVFQGVWRVLRDDGVCWLNLGDSYAGSGSGGYAGGKGTLDGSVDRQDASRAARLKQSYRRDRQPVPRQPSNGAGLRPKNLMGVPWRVAFALQEAGWYLRDAICWHKPTPMPGSQRDRCTTAYELVFQLTKSPRYYFDLDAGRTEASPKTATVTTTPTKPTREPGDKDAGTRFNDHMAANGGRYNVTSAAPRNVWKIAAEPCSDAHFATYPTELPTRCLRLSTSERGCCSECGAPLQRITERSQVTRERPNKLTKRTGQSGTGNHCANTVAGVKSMTLGWRPTCDCDAQTEPCRVLDPFNGAGTTGIACRRLGLSYTGIELNPDYAELTHKRWRRESNRGAKVTSLEPAPDQMSLL